LRPVLFHIGNLAVSSFWAAAFLGFLASMLVLRSECARSGRDVRLAYDITLYSYLGGWAGARLFVIPSGWRYFVENPLAFLLSGSGWVWYGGVVGGAALVWLWARRRGLSMLVIGDLAAPALALGHGIGRIGCQLSGDGDYGGPTDLPWGMSYPHGTVPTLDRVHPTPLYEMAGCFLIFAYLRRCSRGAPPPGDLLGRYFVLAAALRFAIEFVRRNPTWLGGLTTAQWFAAAFALLGCALVWRAGAARSA